MPEELAAENHLGESFDFVQSLLADSNITESPVLLPAELGC